MFSFGFLRPSKRQTAAEEQASNDDSEDAFVQPPALTSASVSRPSRTVDVLRSASAPSGEFLTYSRRRGLDMVLDELSERPKAIRENSIYSSDNGMQLLLDVGKPGCLMDARNFCDVAEWKETPEWKLVKAQQLSTDMAILAKVYKRSNLIPSKEFQIICQERILAKLSGVDGVMRYYRTMSDARHICLIFHQDLRPSLKTFIAIHGGRLREHFVVQKVAAPLVVLMAEVHRHGVIHRNLAPEHVLFSEDRPLVLTDFDHAVDTHPLKSSAEDDFQPGLPNFRVGTLDYMAPEVVNKPTPQEIFHEVVFKGMAEEELPMYDTKADIFSLGAVLFSIMTGKVPWPASTPSELQSAHKNISIQQLIEAECKDLSRECKDFLIQCLHIDPSGRASATSLLNHPWVRSYTEQAKSSFQMHRAPKEETRGRATSSEIARRSLTMNREKENSSRSIDLLSPMQSDVSTVGKVVCRPGHVTKYSKSSLCVDIIKQNAFC